MEVGTREVEVSSASPPSGAAARPPWVVPLVIGCAIVSLVHAYVVGFHYYVGSFDDDANYILTARALLAGRGLTGDLVSGNSVIAAYPPGYPLLIAPIQWLFPGDSAFVAFRVFSALCGAAVLPLTWGWMRRRSMPETTRAAVMVLLALDPVLATFSTMVMAETSLLVALLLLLLAADRWERAGRGWCWPAVAVVFLCALEVWLKEAGLGLVAGVALWYWLRRQWWRGVAVLGGVGASLVPVLVGRVVQGIPFAGARYTEELNNYYRGGLVHRVLVVVPHNLLQWLFVALPQTVVGFVSPVHGLPTPGYWFGWQVTVFTLVGLAVAIRRHRDLTVVAVPVYAAMTLLYPFINQRRVILVLPMILAWYVLGVQATVAAVARAARRRFGDARARRLRPVGRGFVALAAAVLVVLPLASQFPRDYLFGFGQSSSRLQGSRAMELLGALGPHSTVVETEYRYGTALFDVHRTNNTAFTWIYHDGCSLALARRGIAEDHAGFLVIGDLNKPDTTESVCLMKMATTLPWSVRLLRTERDETTVFELIGPGTAHADLRSLLPSASPSGSGGLVPLRLRPLGGGRGDLGDVPGTAPATAVGPGGEATITWRWSRARSIAQVSLGEAGVLAADWRSEPGSLVAAPTTSVAVQAESPAGAWKTLRSAPGAVGDHGSAPYLLDQLGRPMAAIALRVVVRAPAGDLGRKAFAEDFAALGPVPGPRGAAAGVPASRAGASVGGGS